MSGFLLQPPTLDAWLLLLLFPLLRKPVATVVPVFTVSVTHAGLAPAEKSLSSLEELFGCVNSFSAGMGVTSVICIRMTAISVKKKFSFI